MSKKILIATSTSESKIKYSISKIKEYLEQKNYPEEVVYEGANVFTMKLEEIKPDLIVLIGPKNFTTDVPVVDGGGFITKLNALVNTTCENVYSELQLLS